MTLPETQIFIKASVQRRIKVAGLNLTRLVDYFLWEDKGRATRDPSVMMVDLKQNQGTIYLFSIPSDKPLKILVGDAQDLVAEGVVSQAELAEVQVNAEIARNGPLVLH